VDVTLTLRGAAQIPRDMAQSGIGSVRDAINIKVSVVVRKPMTPSDLNRLRWPGMVLRLSGVFLVALGVVHLAATPHIPPLLDGMRSDRGYALARGATLLNHVMTGILLLPLGISTWLASSRVNLLQTWARLVLMSNSLAILCGPICILLFMGDPAYLRAPLFLTGVCLATLIPCLMLLAVLRLWKAG